MRYRNTISGEVIEVEASITGGFWEEFEENDENVVGLGDGEPEGGETEGGETEDVEKPKPKTTRKGRGKRA
ncbi:hypothetical protein [Mogibacterium timidum]|uniref:hypothetical protein n=1 Tax=Mogibacterium timidum TaxID=35519 RepID=UPI00248CFA38|nr:hypothetical protein [Mogibacterium timidum]